MKKSLKAKLLLLLALVLSTIGANMASTASACQECVSIWENGRLVGYGCVNGGHNATCNATSWNCTLGGFCL